MQKIILCLTIMFISFQPGHVAGQAAQPNTVQDLGLSDHIKLMQDSIKTVIGAGLAKGFEDVYKPLSTRFGNLTNDSLFTNEVRGANEYHISDLYLAYDAVAWYASVPDHRVDQTKVTAVKAAFIKAAFGGTPNLDDARALMDKMLTDILGSATPTTLPQGDAGKGEDYIDFINRYKDLISPTLSNADKNSLQTALELKKQGIPDPNTPVTQGANPPVAPGPEEQAAATAQANAEGKLTPDQVTTLVALMNDPAFTKQLATYPAAAKTNLDALKAKLAASTVQVSEEINNNLYLHDLMVTFYVINKSKIADTEKGKLQAIAPIIFSVIPNGITPEAFPDFLMKGVNRLYDAPPQLTAAAKEEVNDEFGELYYKIVMESLRIAKGLTEITGEEKTQLIADVEQKINAIEPPEEQEKALNLEGKLSPRQRDALLEEGLINAVAQAKAGGLITDQQKQLFDNFVGFLSSRNAAGVLTDKAADLLAALSVIGLSKNLLPTGTALTDAMFSNILFAAGAAMMKGKSQEQIDTVSKELIMNVLKKLFGAPLYKNVDEQNIQVTKMIVALAVALYTMRDDTNQIATERVRLAGLVTDDTLFDPTALSQATVDFLTNNQLIVDLKNAALNFPLTNNQIDYVVVFRRALIDHNKTANFKYPHADADKAAQSAADLATVLNILRLGTVQGGAAIIEDIVKVISAALAKGKNDAETKTATSLLLKEMLDKVKPSSQKLAEKLANLSASEIVKATYPSLPSDQVTDKVGELIKDIDFAKYANAEEKAAGAAGGGAKYKVLITRLPAISPDVDALLAALKESGYQDVITLKTFTAASQLPIEVATNLPKDKAEAIFRVTLLAGYAARWENVNDPNDSFALGPKKTVSSGGAGVADPEEANKQGKLTAVQVDELNDPVRRGAVKNAKIGTDEITMPTAFSDAFNEFSGKVKADVLFNYPAGTNDQSALDLAFAYMTLNFSQVIFPPTVDMPRGMLNVLLYSAFISHSDKSGVVKVEGGSLGKLSDEGKFKPYLKKFLEDMYKKVLVGKVNDTNYPTLLPIIQGHASILAYQIVASVYRPADRVDKTQEGQQEQMAQGIVDSINFAALFGVTAPATGGGGGGTGDTPSFDEAAAGTKLAKIMGKVNEIKSEEFSLRNQGNVAAADKYIIALNKWTDAQNAAQDVLNKGKIFAERADQSSARDYRAAGVKLAEVETAAVAAEAEAKRIAEGGVAAPADPTPAKPDLSGLTLGEKEEYSFRPTFEIPTGYNNFAELLNATKSTDNAIKVRATRALLAAAEQDEFLKAVKANADYKSVQTGKMDPVLLGILMAGVHTYAETGNNKLEESKGVPMKDEAGNKIENDEGDPLNVVHYVVINAKKAAPAIYGKARMPWMTAGIPVTANKKVPTPTVESASKRCLDIMNEDERKVKNDKGELVRLGDAIFKEPANTYAIYSEVRKDKLGGTENEKVYCGAIVTRFGNKED